MPFGGCAAMRLLLPALLFGTLCLPSCTDGTESLSRSSHLSFTATVSDAWRLSTRADEGDGLPKDTVTALEGYSEPLYLHMLHEEGIVGEGTDSLSNCSAEHLRTRAAVATAMYGSFSVSAYRYKGGWSGTTETPNLFYNITATGSTTDGYTLPSTYYWPGSAYKVKFFAYAPTDYSGCALSASTQAGVPTLTVSVPTDVSKQQDLLTASSGELSGDYRSDVSLTFKHILTAVNFVCGGDMQAGTVNSVALKGVYGTGTYNMETNSWILSGFATSFTQTLDKTVDGADGTAITTDAQTFMMIPQTLPTDATIEVTFTDSSNERHTLTADIGGTEWPKGSTVTYKLSTTSINWTYTLNVTGLSSSFTYDGGTKSCSVKSYKQNGSTTEAIPWTAKFSTDDGTTWSDTKPDWLTEFTTAGSSTSVQTFNATVAAQTAETDKTHTEALQNATAKGSSSSPYNLSNSTGEATVQNTANCYVVSAPGYYSFPLVYGNAIKNSAANSSAYTSTKSGTTILTNFVNHLGNAITDPYISKNTGCTPSSAELVWQDAENLVTSIKYNNTGSNGGNISFQVDKSTIRQGNAVIAVKDASGNVLWSWHIWVTDEDLTNTIAVTNYSNETNYFMPVNLGWCDYGAVTYAARSCKVKFTAGSLSKEFAINQTEFIFAANNPHYQWGRKDPFPSALSFYRNKPYYDKSGNVCTDDPSTCSAGTGTDALKNYILNPDKMTGSSKGDKTYYNLWSAGNTTYTLSKHDAKVVKTIYDPCPVGFTVPPGRAFTGFTSTGSSVSSSGSGINGTWDSSAAHYGYDFKTSSTGSNTIFFGYQGYRNQGGDYQTYDAYYWTAVPTVTSGTSTDLGGYLSFGFDNLFQATGPSLYLENGIYKGYGCSIRPTKE